MLKLTFPLGLVASRAWSETHELASLKFSSTLVEAFLLFTVLLCFISKQHVNKKCLETNNSGKLPECFQDRAECLRLCMF